jgi:hypothetical protein
MTTTSLTRQSLLNQFRIRKGLVFGVIIITALFAFEIFNYSTTDYALSDLLGDMKFIGIRWATILAIAFCGIDFAGIARLFTPEEYSSRGDGVHNEVWYLFGAWLLAATMNAMLTWWGVSLAILSHETLGNTVINRDLLIRVVPIFVAILVWLIRVLIIGSFSVAGDRLFSQGTQPISSRTRNQTRVASKPSQANSFSQASNSVSGHSYNQNPAKVSARQSHQNNGNNVRTEPTYHSVSMHASTQNTNSSARKISGTQMNNQLRH